MITVITNIIIYTGVKAWNKKEENRHKAANKQLTYTPASDFLMPVVGVLRVVRRIRHRPLMYMLRRRRIRFAEAEFDEHILVITPILLCRMHAVVVYEIVAILVVVRHCSVICAVRAIRRNAVAKGQILRIVSIRGLAWRRVLLGVQRRGEISVTARLSGGWVRIWQSW